MGNNPPAISAALLTMSSKAQPAEPRDILALTRAISAGDEKAFELFYDTYSPQVFRLLLVIVRGNEAFAEELHQRVMIKAAQKIPVIVDEEQLWKWLSQVARNAWRDAMRKQQREAHTLENFAPPHSGPEPETERAIALQHALASLSARQVELVNAFYVDAQNQREISQRTGLSVKAIQSELARIRKKLKLLLTRKLSRTSASCKDEE